MKYLSLTFILITTFCFGQNIDDQAEIELKKLHERNEFIKDSIGKLIHIKDEKANLEKDPKKKEFLMLQVDSLWNISDQNDIDALKIDIKYCQKHPSCMYSFGRVRGQVARQPGKNFYADFEYIYTNAPKQIKESESGKMMAEQLKYFKQSMVGSSAPNFAGLDVNGKILSLEEFKNKKYVLIDFWASWCGPCRGEIPFLKSLSEKYKNLDFEVVSISDDQDLDKWKKAIEKEQIQNWKNFSIAQNNSTIKTDYFVYGIPHKVLIDKNGIIIGKWKASGELNKNELAKQLKNIFGY